MPRLGVVFTPDHPPEQLRDVVRAAEESGLDELWLWEDCFREGGLAAATAALAWSERLTVGVGLMPVPLRNVALTAMELATIERMFPGRHRPAVGHGVQDWMGQVGARAESPLTLLREYVDALRRLLAGERLGVDGRYVHLHDVALDWPPVSAPPILAGAVGPKSQRLVGEVADGVVITGGTSVEDLAAALALVDEGRVAAGRPATLDAVVYLIAVTGPGAEERLRADITRWELDPEQELGVAGDAATIADAVRRRADAGAGTVVLQPAGDEPDLALYARFCGEQVAPLVRGS